jgi:hypothetical protein
MRIWWGFCQKKKMWGRKTAVNQTEKKGKKNNGNIMVKEK